MLTGPEQLQWRDALFDTFSERELTGLLGHRLGERISRYASANLTWEEAIGELVDAYSRRDKEDHLIAKAVEMRPKNAALMRLARSKRAHSAPAGRSNKACSFYRYDSIRACQQIEGSVFGQHREWFVRVSFF